MGGKAGNMGGIGNRPGVGNWKPPGGFGGGMGGGSVNAGPQVPGGGPMGGQMFPGGERPGTYGVGGPMPPVTGGPLPPFNPGQMPPQGMRPTGGGIGQPIQSIPPDNSGGQPWVSAGQPNPGFQPNPGLPFGRFRPRGF